ncbi:MAG: hypothetical protein J5J00_16080 [Deltaproteobacteria bacterium]|nr:hypothetical protein [Deltaproteobacteria bacterium]
MAVKNACATPLVLAALGAISGCAGISNSNIEALESWEQFWQGVSIKYEVRPVAIDGLSRAVVGKFHANSEDAKKIKRSFASVCTSYNGKILPLWKSRYVHKFSIHPEAFNSWHQRIDKKYSLGEIIPFENKYCIDEKSQEILSFLAIAQAGRSSKDAQETVLALVIDKEKDVLVSKYKEERDATQNAWSERSAKESRELQSKNEKLRKNPRIGDKVRYGLIIEIKPPLALIQHDPSHREYYNLPASEWVRIESLEVWE